MGLIWWLEKLSNEIELSHAEFMFAYKYVLRFDNLNEVKQVNLGQLVFVCRYVRVCNSEDKLRTVWSIFMKSVKFLKGLGYFRLQFLKYYCVYCK